MSKRAHLSFGLVGSVAVCFAVIVGAGCGDDESSGGGAVKGGQGGEESAAGGSAGSSGRVGGIAGSAAGASGQTGMGKAEEGDNCMTTAECMPGMQCVSAAAQGVPIKICARPCTSAAQCGTESCASPFTQMPKDNICVNTEPAPFALCGAGVTAVCGGDRRCLYLPDSTVGICINLCALDPSKDAGLDGLPLTCPIAAQSCISGIVDDGGLDAVGLCGTEVERDAECGLENGKLCKGSDICVPDNFDDLDSKQHCREDCSKMGTCTTGGTCTPYQRITYCKK